MLGITNNITQVKEQVHSVLQDMWDIKTPAGWLLYGVLMAVLAWVVARATRRAFERMLEKPRYHAADRTAIRFLAQLSQLIVYAFAFVLYAHLVPPLQKLGNAWLASVGVVSVVFGLAAQNTLGNLIAGISLLLYRPFNLGDRLQVNCPSGLETGIVESLNLGYTILRTVDDRRVVIPNSLMASQTNVNLSLTDERKLCAVPFRLSQNADLNHARRILTELAKQHPKVLEYAGCPVTALGSDSVTLSVQVWCRDGIVAGDIKNDLLEAALKRFEQEGIELFSLRSIWNGEARTLR